MHIPKLYIRILFHEIDLYLQDQSLNQIFLEILELLESG